MTGAQASHTLIRAGRIIDGLGGPPIERGALLVRDSKIVDVGPERNMSVPEGGHVEVLDYSDKTIMPGMVDCHTHHNGFGDGRAGDDLATLPDEILVLQSARNARTSLLTGVTTIRENGPKNVTMLRLKDAINDGREIGPRMVLCGRPVAIIGGHMDYMGSVVTGVVAGRAMVRQLVKEGADYIKITATGGTTRTSFPLLPSFNVDELSAIVDEAHKFGKLTATHCSSTQGIVNSLDSGVDMIIHCIFKDGDGTDRFREDVAERIGNRGVFINPTLHVHRSTIWALEHKKADTGLTAFEQTELDQQLRQFEIRMEDTYKLIKMGLKVITGSDSSWADYKLGNTVHEIECLVQAGFSPMQGVQSVTSEAAKAVGVDGEVGTLETGKQADVIAVQGNPDEDIGVLWDVADVMLAGKLVDRGSQGPIDDVRQHSPYRH